MAVELLYPHNLSCLNGNETIYIAQVNYVPYAVWKIVYKIYAAKLKPCHVPPDPLWSITASLDSS